MKVDVAPTPREMVREMIVEYERYTGRDIRALDLCLDTTEHLWVGCVGDVPLCAWGLVPPTLLADEAYLWMILLEGWPEVHTFVLARETQIQVAKMLEMYPVIRGHCEVSDLRAQRFMRFLKAEFGYPDGPLLPFVIRRANG